MSTEPTVNTNTSAIPEPANNTGADVTKTVPDEAPKQTNGDSHPAKPDGIGHTPGESKSTDASGPADTAKPAEEPLSGGPVQTSGAGSQEPAGEAKSDAPSTGDKRELESVSGPTDTDKPVTESSDPPAVAPTAKKQKTDENATTENDTQANGEKKKTGRPKKVKEAVKKVIPTDGIGSRTRSRTKAVS